MSRKFRPLRATGPAVLSALLVAIFVAGCGYSTKGRTAKDIKNIYVPFFSNSTTEPNLEITVTESIIENLISDNTLKVTDEDRSDAVLQGDIESFENRPFSFNQDLNAEEYRVIIRVKVSLLKKGTSTPIWKDQTISGDGSYFLETVDDGNTLEDAIAEAIQEITDRILNLTVQDW